MAKLCEVNTPDVVRHTLRSVSCKLPVQIYRPWAIIVGGGYYYGGWAFISDFTVSVAAQPVSHLTLAEIAKFVGLYSCVV